MASGDYWSDYLVYLIVTEIMRILGKCKAQRERFGESTYVRARTYVRNFPRTNTPLLALASGQMIEVGKKYPRREPLRCVARGWRVSARERTLGGFGERWRLLL